MPFAAPRARARIAFADARHARRRRTSARAPRQLPASRAPLAAMDLDAHVRPGRHRSLRAVHKLYRTRAEPFAGRGLRRDQSARAFNFPGRLLEGMAIDDFIGGSVGAGNARNIYRSGSAPQAAPRLHVSHVARRHVRRNADARRHDRDGIPQRPERRSYLVRSHQERSLP